MEYIKGLKVKIESPRSSFNNSIGAIEEIFDGYCRIKLENPEMSVLFYNFEFKVIDYMTPFQLANETFFSLFQISKVSNMSLVNMSMLCVYLMQCYRLAKMDFNYLKGEVQFECLAWRN